MHTHMFTSSYYQWRMFTATVATTKGSRSMGHMSRPSPADSRLVAVRRMDPNMKRSASFFAGAHQTRWLQFPRHSMYAIYAYIDP